MGSQSPLPPHHFFSQNFFFVSSDREFFSDYKNVKFFKIFLLVFELWALYYKRVRSGSLGRQRSQTVREKRGVCDFAKLIKAFDLCSMILMRSFSL